MFLGKVQIRPTMTGGSKSNMEILNAYLTEHPEIEAGVFCWYDLFRFYGIVNGHKEEINANVFSDDISIDTDSRAALLKWTCDYEGFDDFFADPETARRHTSADGRRVKADYWRVDYATFADSETFLEPDPDDPGGEFASYEDFKAAVCRELDAEDYIYSFCGELPDIQNAAPENITKLKAAYIEQIKAAAGKAQAAKESGKPEDYRRERLLVERCKRNLFEIEQEKPAGFL